MTNSDEAVPQEIFFRISGGGDAPWETGRPQSAIIKLVEQGVFHGKILDIGCGIGDNAIYIMNNVNNVQITAIDLVPRAIEVAREKAKRANVNIEFEVFSFTDDLSKTNLKKHTYDVVLDAAVFHSFSNEDRQRYIKNLESLIKPNGLYIQLVYSDKETRQGGPRRIKKSDLHDLFSSKNGWTIQSIEDSVYEWRSDTSLGADGRAYLSFIRKN